MLSGDYNGDNIDELIVAAPGRPVACGRCFRFVGESEVFGKTKRAG